jgi:cytochrome c oxidase subunit 4
MDSHAHEQHGQGKDHVPHVLPLSTYLKTWAALMVLTAITVGVSYLNFGGANLWIALIVASIKASIVALVFMHLFYDHKFHSIIMVITILFLGVFISFTMFDTETRGKHSEAIEGERPADVKQPFAGTRSEAELKARSAQGSEKPAEK